MFTNPFIPLLYLAGAFYLLIALVNFFLPGKIQLKENLAHVSLFIRQIFQIHTVFIVLTTLFYASLCFIFPRDLLVGTALSRFICGFIGVYWLLRLSIQFFYYDQSVLKKHALAHWFFSAVFLYQGLVFGTIALGFV